MLEEFITGWQDSQDKKRNFKFFILTILPSCCFFFASSLCASKLRDFQIWNYDVIQGQLYKRLDLYTELSFRWKDNATRFFYNHEHFELITHATPWLDIGPAYRQIWNLVDTKNRKWETIYQPNLNIYLLWQLGSWYFSDRSRAGYLFFDAKQRDVWFYRNKLSTYTICMREPFEIRFFLDDEIFIQEKQRGIFQNRFSVGFVFPLMQKVKGEIGYRRQTIRQTDGWHNNDVLLLDIRVQFGPPEPARVEFS